MLVTIQLFGEVPGAGSRTGTEKKEVDEVLGFSGLEAQGQINRLLDELFGESEQAYSTAAKGCKDHEAKIPADCESAENETNKELDVVRELVLAP